MKVLIMLTMVFAFQTIASVYSQNTKISLNYEDALLGDVLSQIEKDTEFVFFFRHGSIDQNIKVNIHAQDKNIDYVLSEIFRGTGIEWTVKDRLIILGEKDVDVVTALQGISITGRVTDVTGETLPGVNVSIQGTALGVATDANGNYSISVPNTSTVLMFSYIGYLTQEFRVGNQTVVNIILRENIREIEEVVVVGYGTVRKRDVTGSVASVKGEVLRELPANNISQALQGRISGVQIQQNSGAPGANIQVRIRGINSISGSNEPLWIINGFPGSQEMINTSDIESIEVLKDASATAIYGSRAANGVIIVTTKQAKTGKVAVDYDGSYGIQTVRKKIELMNASEYAQFYNTIWKTTHNGEDYFSQSELNQFGKGTDWQDLIFRAAPVQDHAVNIYGGNDKTQFLFGTSIFDQKGIVRENTYQRIVLRANINHEINKYLSVSYNSILSRINRSPINEDVVIRSALSAMPTVGPYTDDGKYTILNTVYPFGPDNLTNPEAYFNEVSGKSFSNNVMANLAITYKPIDGLSIKISGNVTNVDNRSDSYTGLEYPNSSGSASISSSNSVHINSDNIVNYQTTINGLHNINVTGAVTYEKYTSKSVGASGTGFLSDVIESYDIGSASTPGIPSSSWSDWTLLSYLGRINYSYNNKYLATISFRADGSSRYSKGNKWGYFPSGALAWRITEENFMKAIQAISDAKLRIGYGMTGSTAINPYYTLDMLSSGKAAFNNDLYTSFAPGTRLPRNLKWETTEQTNIGLDISFLSNRLNFTVDYYVKNTRDLLNTAQLPASLGYTTTVINVGKMRNSGVEFLLSAMVLDGDFKWNVSPNISFNRNKVIKLNESQDILGTIYNASVYNDYVNLLREGEPISIFYSYQWDGFDENGHYKYKDNNGDGAISENDKRIIGNPNPDFIYGFTSDFSWKNFDLNIFIQGSYGNDIMGLSSIIQNNRVYLGINTQKEVFYDHWTPEHTQAKYPAMDITISSKIADRFVYDGSYLRLKNIRFAYNMPVDKLKWNWLKKGQIYVSGQNLLTMTGYPWWDPDVNSRGGGNSINQGIDEYSYPTAKSVTFGLKLSF